MGNTASSSCLCLRDQDVVSNGSSGGAGDCSLDPLMYGSHYSPSSSSGGSGPCKGQLHLLYKKGRTSASASSGVAAEHSHSHQYIHQPTRLIVRTTTNGGTTTTTTSASATSVRATERIKNSNNKNKASAVTTATTTTTAASAPSTTTHIYAVRRMEEQRPPVPPVPVRPATPELSMEAHPPPPAAAAAAVRQSQTIKSRSNDRNNDIMDDTYDVDIDDMDKEQPPLLQLSPAELFTPSAMARKPTFAVPDWVVVSEELQIYVLDSGLTYQECNQLVAVTECACRGQYAAYTYAKQTLGCRDYPTLAQECWTAVHRVVHAIQTTLSTRLPLKLDEREPHVVKYDVSKKERQKLDMHTDKSEWTFLISLSDGCGRDYDGGGTYFEALEATIHVQRGHALVFPGKLRHCGQRITKGVRFLLVGFLVDANAATTATGAGGGLKTTITTTTTIGASQEPSSLTGEA